MNFSGVLSLSLCQQRSYLSHPSDHGVRLFLMLRMRNRWAWASPWKCTYPGSGGTAEHMQMTLVLMCTRLIH